MRVEYAEQTTLEGATKRIPTSYRFDTPIAELRQVLEAVRHECQACGDYGYAVERDRAHNIRPIAVYDCPWYEAPTITWRHAS